MDSTRDSGSLDAGSIPAEVTSIITNFSIIDSKLMMQLPADTKVVIVGGGLAGCTLAHTLHQNNIKFILLDNPTKQSCSRVAAGIVNPINFFKINLSWWADRCLAYNISFFKTVSDTLQTEVYQGIAYKKIFTSAAEKTKWKQKQNDVEVSDYISIDTTKMQNEKIIDEHGVGCVHGAAWLNVPLFLEKSKLFFEKLDCWHEQELHYDYTAKLCNEMQNLKIIFCEGASIIENPYFDYCVMKISKGEILTLHQPGLQLQNIVNKGAYVLPIGDDKYLIGATYVWDENNERITTEGKEHLLTLWQQISNLPAEVLHHKAGVRPASRDRRPVVGASARQANVYCLNGLGTKGAMHAARLSQILYEHIFEDKPIEFEINTTRFLKKKKINLL